MRGPVHTSKLLADRASAVAYPTGEIAISGCEDCGLLTNTTFDAPHHDYTASYEEVQAFSPRFVAYATDLAERLTERHGLRGGHVFEIGCGQTDFLRILCDVAGATAEAVDPSWRPSDLPQEWRGRISVARSFFDRAAIGTRPDLVVCRHTLEHVHDVRWFLAELREALAPWPETPVVFEIPETARILRAVAFWDVYYEHCSYFTPGSLARAFRHAGFRPTALELGFDDQYALVTAVAGEGGETLALEEPASAMDREASLFAGKLDEQRAYWVERLGSLHAAGKTSAIWGAGSKGVGFLAALGLGPEVACAVDLNPSKHGMYLPGTGHEIVPPERLLELRPDVVVVMNPAYLAEISANVAELGLDADVVAL